MRENKFVFHRTYRVVVSVQERLLSVLQRFTQNLSCISFLMSTICALKLNLSLASVAATIFLYFSSLSQLQSHSEVCHKVIMLSLGSRNMQGHKRGWNSAGSWGRTAAFSPAFFRSSFLQLQIQQHTHSAAQQCSSVLKD